MAPRQVKLIAAKEHVELVGKMRQFSLASDSHLSGVGVISAAGAAQATAATLQKILADDGKNSGSVEMVSVISPDGEFIVIGDRNGEISITRVPTGERLGSFQAHAGPVTSLAFSESRLISGGEDGHIHFWIPWQGFRRLRTLIPPVGHKNGTSVHHLAAARDGTAYLLPRTFGSPVVTSLEVEDTSQIPTDYPVDLPGASVAEIARNGAVRGWGARTVSVGRFGFGADEKAVIHATPALLPSAESIHSILDAKGGDEPVIFARNHSGGFLFMRPKSGPVVPWTPEKERLPVLQCLDDNGQRLFTVDSQERLAAWDTTNGRLVAEIDLKPEPAARNDGSDVDDLAEISTRTEWSMIAASGGACAVSSTDRCDVLGLDSGSFQRRVFHGFNSVKRLDAVTILAVSPDGKRILRGNGSQLELIERDTGNVRPVVRSGSQTITAAAFSPRGDFLLLADDQGEVAILDPELGIDVLSIGTENKKVSNLRYYAPPIVPEMPGNVVDVRAEPRIIAPTSDRDSTSTISERINSLTWTSDGRTILAGLEDGRVKMWSIDSPEPESPLGMITLPEDLSARLASSGSKLARMHLLTCAIDDYRYLPKTRFSKTAAKKLSNALISVGAPYFQPGLEFHLIDGQVTPANIAGTLDRLIPSLAAEDLIVVFLAGAGVRNDRGKFSLLLHDVKGSPETFGEGSGIGLDHFLRLAATKAKVLLIVESSRAGAIVDDIRTTTPLTISSNWGILAATTSNNDAQESELFSDNSALGYALLQGLSGEADGNADGAITVGEIFQFSADMVNYRLTGRTQQPVYWPPISDAIENIGNSIMNLPIAKGRSAPEPP